MRHRLFVALLVSGCGWNNLPQQDYTSATEPLWDASAAIPAADGLYLHLPLAGALIRVRSGGEVDQVDLGEGRVRTVTLAPDEETLVTFVDRERCLDEDCEETERFSEAMVVRDAKAGAALDLDGTFNAVTFSADRRWGAAYLDVTQDIKLQGVTNLTSIVLLDLQSGATTPVAVGFAAEQVLFVDDPAGASKVLALSKNTVAVVDLLAQPPAVEATYPLTLDADARVRPVGVDVTPDGRYAMLSIDGSPDLYALDLLDPSINIVELSAAPSAMVVNDAADRTVLVYRNLAAAEIVDHTFFDVDRVALEEPMSSIAEGDEVVLLWDDRGNKDVYRVDLLTGEATEYVLENPPFAIALAPGEDFAVALTRPEGGGGAGVEGFYDSYPGLEILSLRSDESAPYVLEGQGVGLAFSAVDGRLDALVLQAGVDYLHRIDLLTGQQDDLALSAAPIAIGTMPDGVFFITHDVALGLISFLDPATGDVTELSGFAQVGLLDDVEPIPSSDEVN
jgi:hypothetical protein